MDVVNGNDEPIVYPDNALFALQTDDLQLVLLQGATTPATIQRITFNASRANSIYGNSTTVQPAAIRLIPQIKY